MNKAEDFISVGGMFYGLSSGKISREIFEDWLDNIKLSSWRDGAVIENSLDKYTYGEYKMASNLNLVEAAIEKLSDIEKQEIISEFETLARCGEIGDCKLRKMAQELCYQIDYRGNSDVYMTKIGCACYKYFAKLYLSRNIHSCAELFKKSYE